MTKKEVELISSAIKELADDAHECAKNQECVRDLTSRIDCLLWVLEATGNQDEDLGKYVDSLFEA